MAEEYPKNFSLLRMAEKYKKKKEEEKVQSPQVQEKDDFGRPVNKQESIISKGSSMISNNSGTTRGSIASNAGVPQVVEDTTDMCPMHQRKIEIICIDCKERICSNCALFGNHKQHDIRMEQDVLEEINIRTECLMEMYQHLAQAAQEKPDEQQVNQIYDQFKKKSTEMKIKLKDRFKEMRVMLKV